MLRRMRPFDVGVDEDIGDALLIQLPAERECLFPEGRADDDAVGLLLRDGIEYAPAGLLVELVVWEIIRQDLDVGVFFQRLVDTG